MTVNTTGAAFIGGATTWGLTLRDYFAAAAMQGMFLKGNVSTNLEHAAVQAYLYADAMLVERAKNRSN